jgi:hypothetical protein
MIHVQTGNMLDVVVEGKSIGLKQRDSDHRKPGVIWLPDPEALAMVLLAELKRLQPTVSPAAEKWLQIETAPIGSQRILGGWYYNSKLWVWGQCEYEGGWYCRNGGVPTHWMPLPAPPNSPAAVVTQCLCGLDTNPTSSPRMGVFCPKHDAAVVPQLEDENNE